MEWVFGWVNYVDVVFVVECRAVLVSGASNLISSIKVPSENYKANVLDDLESERL